MIYCRMDLDKVSPDGKTILLYCSGVGIFPVFTGLAPYTNKAGCASRENGPIPTGKYWIIDRPREVFVQGLEMSFSHYGLETIMMNGLRYTARMVF